MASIASVATALPAHRYGTESIIAAGQHWLGADSSEFGLFERFVRSACIDQRYFAMPIEQVLNLTGTPQRAEIFCAAGVHLAEQAAHAALNGAQIKGEQVDTLVFASCSLPLIPTLDAYIVERGELGLRRDVRRVPVYQFGCAGGAAGLALAAQLAEPNRTVLLINVELCSLVYHRSDRGRASILGGALFGDGAAATVLQGAAVPAAAQPKLNLLATHTYLLPNSQHLMGYDLLDDGAHLRLDRELPSRLAEAVPQQVATFLNRHGLNASQVDWWLFHPGGSKILTALEEALELKRSQCHWSWDVLRECGNMSSATLPFVTERFLADREMRPGQYCLVLGIGPGLSLEMALFKV